jgi:hypothetical protein
MTQQTALQELSSAVWLSLSLSLPQLLLCCCQLFETEIAAQPHSQVNSQVQQLLVQVGLQAANAHDNAFMTPQTHAGG